MNNAQQSDSQLWCSFCLGHLQTETCLKYQTHIEMLEIQEREAYEALQELARYPAWE